MMNVIMLNVIMQNVKAPCSSQKLQSKVNRVQVALFFTSIQLKDKILTHFKVGYLVSEFEHMSPIMNQVL